jgi:hypothetical protein
MKKLIALSLLILLASAAFAEGWFNWSGFGRGVFVPLQVVDPYDKDGLTDEQKEAKTYTGVGATWGSPAARVGISFNGGTEQIGYSVDLIFDGGAVGFDNNALAWIKPAEFIKLTFGRYHLDELRGKITDGDYHNFVLSTKDEDAIFNRFKSDTAGFQLALTPIEGLFIAAALNDIPGAFLGTAYVDGRSGTYLGYDAALEAEDAYKKIQIAAGYEIPNIGHARLQFIGGAGAPPSSDDLSTTEINAVRNNSSFEDPWYSDDPGIPESAATTNLWDAGRIEAAFAYTGLSDLVVDLGIKFWLPVTYKDENLTGDKTWTYSNDFGLAVGATYSTGDFAITGRVDTAFAGSFKKEDESTVTKGFSGDIHLIPSYSLGPVTLGLEVGVGFVPSVTYDPDVGDSYVRDKGGFQFGIGAWGQLGVAGGYLKAGLGLTLSTVVAETTSDGGDTYPDANKYYQPFVFSIPIIYQYAF